MTRRKPLISVVIPVFNGCSYLAEAVSSVRAQSHEPLEVIIVDDGSTDATPRIIGGLGGNIKALNQPNRGPGAARNRGLEVAAGEFFAFIDADDLWVPGKLENQLWRLQTESAADIVIGATQRVRAAFPGGGMENVGPTWMLFHLGAGLFRREAFDRVGGFDETLRQAEDVDWFMRAREAGLNIVIGNEVAQLYRMHGSNMTRNQTDKDHFFLAAMKKSLDRRRTQSRGTTELPPVGGLAGFLPDSGFEDS